MSIKTFAAGLAASLIISLAAPLTALAAPIPVDAYMASGATGDCTISTPCSSFSDAMNKVSKGGTIHMADGDYTGDIVFTKDQVTIAPTSQAAPDVTVTADDSQSYGVTIDHFNKETITGINFVVPTESSIAYDLHAHNARGLTLQNDTFTSNGGNNAGGVDVNSVHDVTEDTVTATGFHKNGFSFTAQYNDGDQVDSHVALSNITATNNGWAGIAFYTTNSAGTVGHTMRGVTFGGSNTVSGNGQVGIFLEGDSDANLASHSSPSYKILGPGDAPINVGNTAFANNGLDILNYQNKKLYAQSATFDGVKGNDMSNTQRSAEHNKLFYHVVFYDQARATSPANGAVKKNAGTLSWSKVKNAVAYQYESTNVNGNVNDSDNSLQNIIYSTTVTTNHIDASGTAPGTYWWQVRPVFSDSSHGVWSVPVSITVKP